MGPQTERFEMRLDQSLLDRIDTWCDKQDDVPSRAEAVRRLLEYALATTSGAPLVLNNNEKLIVSLLCEIYKGMKIKGEFDPDFIQSVLHGGHYWALKSKYEGLFYNYHDDVETYREVVDILDMWSFIEEAIGKLSPKDKDYIKTNTKETSNDIKFNGFDGNNEHKHLNIAHFLINKMGSFTEFRDRGGYNGDLNCHYPSLEMHRRMLNAFIPIRKKLIGRSLDAKEMVEILKASIHPTMRDKEA